VPGAGRYRLAGLFTLVLLYGTPALAEAPASLERVKSAVAQLDATDLDADWYFTMEVTEGEDVRIIESDPTRDGYERRQLVSVNGQPPDESQLDTFRKAEKKRIDRLDPDTAGYVYLVDTGTLALENAGDDYTRYMFTPRVRDMESSRDQLQGTLLLNNDTGRVDRLEINNTDQLSPAFSVTVDTYRLALGFGDEQGEQLLKTLESVAVGKAGFLKRFDSDVTIHFRDFRRTGP